MLEAGGESMRAGLSRRLAESRSRNIALRVIPMIDILFLLLIFFILTSSFKPVESFLPFVLPKVGGSGTAPSIVEPLIINLHSGTGSANVHIGQGPGTIIKENDTEACLVVFADDLEKTMTRQKRTAGDPVEIVCQDGVEWQYVVKVYDVLFGMGISDITFRMTE
jgi:biopolymer transport protein ExbD